MVNLLAIALHSNAKYIVAHSYKICALTPIEEATTLTRDREEPSIVTKKKLFVQVRTKEHTHMHKGENTISHTKKNKISLITRKKQLPYVMKMNHNSWIPRSIHLYYFIHLVYVYDSDTAKERDIEQMIIGIVSPLCNNV